MTKRAIWPTRCLLPPPLPHHPAALTLIEFSRPPSRLLLQFPALESRKYGCALCPILCPPSVSTAFIQRLTPRRDCYRHESNGEKWSGRMDLNHRPPGPEPGALARLRYAPTDCRSKKETPLERTQKNSTAPFGHSRFIAYFSHRQRLVSRFFTAALSAHPEGESTAPP